VLGASSALVDFIRRYPTALSVFEKGQEKLPDAVELKKRLTSVVQKAALSEAAWVELRRAYRLELLRLASYDVSASHPTQVLSLVAATLADLAAGR